MAIPLIINVSFASEAVPIVAGLLVRDRPRPVLHQRAIIWFCVLMISDEVALTIAKMAANNLWLNMFTMPVEVGLYLWMISALQPTQYLRTAYIMAIAILGTGVVAFLMLVGSPEVFDLWVSPVLALVSLASVLQTLLLRSLQSRAPLTQQDWFWFCIGLSVFWLSFVSASMFLRMFVSQHPEWVYTALQGRAWVNTAAYFTMAFGLLLPWLRARSSGSS